MDDLGQGSQGLVRRVEEGFGIERLVGMSSPDVGEKTNNFEYIMVKYPNNLFLHGSRLIEVPPDRCKLQDDLSEDPFHLRKSLYMRVWGER